MKVLGIDPGLDGAFVLYDGKVIQCWDMPTKSDGKTRAVDFEKVHELISSIGGQYHAFLERAVAFGMGTTGAFNYGRGFAAIEIALIITGTSHTYVEPGKWTKIMHQGIAKDLKPKAKSLIAVQRLYPKLIKSLPVNRNGKLYDGHIDALLIAGYGYNQFHGAEDFY